MSRITSRSTIITLIVSVAMFMENMDATVISTAIPAMARSFGTDARNLSLGISAYLISLAVFIPVSGWIADRFGSRKTFCTAIAGFVLASIGCAFCHHLGEFVLARWLQGIGGAMMVPVGRLVIIQSIAKAELVDAFAYMTIPSVVAPLMGAPVGGFIVTYASWQWIFLINVPIGLALLAGARLVVPDVRAETSRRLDWPGFLMIGIAVSAVVFGLELAARRGADLVSAALLVVVGCAVGALAIRHLRTTIEPLLDLSILRVPTFHASAVGGACYRVACGAVPLVLPLMLQLGLGMSAALSGSLTLFGALGGLAMKGPARAILKRYGFRRVLINSGIVSGISMMAVAAISGAWPIWLIAFLLLLGGFLRSLEFTALMAIAWADLAPSKTSAGTSLFGLLQQVSFSGGIAYGALLLNLAAARHVLHPAATLGDFRFAFVGIGGLAALNALTFMRLPAMAGAEVSGHRAT